MTDLSKLDLMPDMAVNGNGLANTTTDAIYRVLQSTLNHPHLEGFSPASRLNEDLYIDSVLLLQLIVQLELQEGYEIPDSSFTKEDFSTVASLVAFLDGLEENAVTGSGSPLPQPDPVYEHMNVHGEEYIDIKVHCFVSCVCDSLKRCPGIDHRPFYFSVWDADFAVTEDAVMTYHAPSVNHDFFRYWFECLYGIGINSWYQADRSKAQNIQALCKRVEQCGDQESVMVMLDMYHLPERENKFNQNPFPHYVLLETTENPDVWLMRDPDYRWEGELPKKRILQAVDKPTVSGGWLLDRSSVTSPTPDRIREYFNIAFQSRENPLVEGCRKVIRAHVEGLQPLPHLNFALRELPVISVRKYAYEHGFAFFWRELVLPDDEFEYWCDEIEVLIQGYKAIHYLVVKLSESLELSLLEEIDDQLNLMDKQEFRIKEKLQEVFVQWCDAKCSPVKALESEVLS
ncbi:DUF6005 family protein [Parasalinivibrio latis]|uniref:DUF6005 family protein n=1 Tax=Parasalinivibrio latis TaxID=2952610 RepID=UPI0030E491D7